MRAGVRLQGLASSLVLAATPALAQAPTPLTHADAEAISLALDRAADEGLPSPDASTAVAAIDGPGAAARAAATTMLSALAVALAAEEHGMRIDPRAIDHDFALRAPYDAATDFAAARAAGRVSSWVAHLAPEGCGYQDLVAARRAYAAIVAQGGWGAVPAGKLLKPGAADARVPVLRERLAAEGYASAAPPDIASADFFDPSLAAALAAFQARHALSADGELTTQTTAALNVPAEARLAAIDANLERLRWLPHDLPADRVEVDTGDPRATLFQAGVPTLNMRAIVGQPSKRTPTFASQIVAVKFNPPWIVPTDIAARELYPKERRSPGYFARNDFYVARGQLIQRAGPKSSLGYVKFEMQDPFGVYLHDTPARALFSRDKRWLSHGCMRLQDARALAAALLAPQGWTRAAVDAAIAAGATATTTLKAPIPVFVIYRTVVADADGRAWFRPDTYGWDAKLSVALGSGGQPDLDQGG